MAILLLTGIVLIALLVFACHVLKIASIFGVILLLVPLAAVVYGSLIAGGIGLAALYQIFGPHYFAGEIAAAGVFGLACGYGLMRRVLFEYKRAAQFLGRTFGRANA